MVVKTELHYNKVAVIPRIIPFRRINLFTGFNCSGKTDVINQLNWASAHLLSDAETRGNLTVLRTCSYGRFGNTLIRTAGKVLHSGGDQVRQHFAGESLKGMLPPHDRRNCKNYFSLDEISRWEPEDLVVWDKPENDRHPRVITEMLLELLRRTRDQQIILETHSEHVVEAVRLSACRKEINHDDVNILWFPMDRCMSPRVITVGERGEIDHWPDGFMDQRERVFDEMYFNKERLI